MTGWRSALLLLTASCNLVFGLEHAVPRPPDSDGDEIDDDVDNCPLAPNNAQQDSDGDLAGDDCDFCPSLATTINHDEDGDLRGDECDVCPTEPDFGADSDGDGVGDSCDLDAGTAMALVDFSAFLDLSGWSTQTIAWQSTGDTAAPLAPLPPDDPGLAADLTRLDGTRHWSLRVGVLSKRPWADGDRFGVSFVNSADGEPAGCFVTCAGDRCVLKLMLPTGSTSMATVVPLPLVRLRVDYYPTFTVCFLESASSLTTSNHAPLGSNLVPALVGTPDIQFRYFAAWQ